MQHIKVHIFETIEQAEKAIKAINQGEGIPVNEQATTRTYCEVQIYGELICINADNITEKYLDNTQIIDYEFIDEQL